MKRLMEVPLDNSGAVVLVEVDEDEPGYDRATSKSPDELMDRTGGSVQGALERVIRPTAQVVVNQFRQLQPDSVEIEFGLRLTGKAGAVFASSELEGHLQVKLTWSGPPVHPPQTG